MLDVNNKILWLADYDLDVAPGGAQRSDKIIIDQGRLLGYNILKLNHETYNSNVDLNKYDILVTSNLSALSKANPNLIDDISKHKYHVRIEHDSNDYLKQEDRIKLFGSCVKTVFLSDFHLAFFKNFYGDIFKNVEIIYDPIDTKVFTDYQREREDKTLYSGYMHMLKGTYDFFSFALLNPDKKFVLAGWTDDPVLYHLSNTVPNVEYIGIKQYEEMPLVYNKYKYMFYSPNLNEPFCRSVAEAISCGMLLFTSKHNQIGCVKEIYKVGTEKFKEDCAKAALTFWQKI